MATLTGCTIETCPLVLARLNKYPFWREGNLFYLSIFGLLVLMHAYQLYIFRTWSFSIAMMISFIVEIVGYAGRIPLHFNPFRTAPFLTYLISITIAPLFLTAAIYFKFSRSMVFYGTPHYCFSPKDNSILFMTSDIISLFLQASDGAASVISGRRLDSDHGIHIMVAGLIFQAVSLLIFMGLALEYVWQVRRERKWRKNERGNPTDAKKRARVRFLVIGLAIAALFILVQSIFRIVEFWDGVSGILANQEVPFMLLEGGMIVLASTTLNVLHPGLAFSPKWEEVGRNWGKTKDNKSDVVVPVVTESSGNSRAPHIELDGFEVMLDRSI